MFYLNSRNFNCCSFSVFFAAFAQFSDQNNKNFQNEFFLFYYQSGFNKERKLALFSYNCNTLFISYYG